MPVTDLDSAFANSTAVSISLSQMFNVTQAASNPTYVVLTALDRNEYTKGASGATGSFTGNGHTLTFSSIGGDGRGAGIVFTYQASTGRYYNSTYGYMDQLVYNSSSSSNDITNISLFGSNNLAMAGAYAGNVYSMVQTDAAGYIGSATVATQPAYTGTVPTQATPDSIAAIAQSFVGKTWNLDGCWVLASTIAAEAGASLPVQSSEIDVPGQANGEWVVAFNGPAGQTGNWASSLTAGEMVVIGNPGGGGHITTIVSGSGGTATVVDNAEFETSSGTIENAAKDGDSSDIIIQAPHLASQEFSGVAASSVVVYELDTPIVTDKVTTASVSAAGSLSLASLFTATDPGSKAITAWQVYDTATTDMLAYGGSNYSEHSAANALTANALSGVSLLGGTAATTDTIEVRAYNGSFWGDWQALTVTVSAATTQAASPPAVTSQTAAQTWLGGKAFALTLPANTFTDPQNQSLTYSAKLGSGQALPSWLSFNAANDSFTGTAPATAQSLSVTVTATDTSGLSATESFSATVIGAPTVTTQTANQTWTEGSAIALALPGNAFTDPQNQALTYTAKLSGGGALPSWLTFNGATDTFSGTAPNTAQSLALTVTATDASGLSASESFTATVLAATPVAKPGITVSNPTQTLTWTDGQSLDVVLPSNTFTDALGLKMTFAAYEVAGTNVTSWLRFNAATDTFLGTVPTNQTGAARLEVVATDADHMIATDLFTVNLVAAASHSTASTSVGSAQLYAMPQAQGIAMLHG